VKLSLKGIDIALIMISDNIVVSVNCFDGDFMIVSLSVNESVNV
jgi:hypothetical protein